MGPKCKECHRANLDRESDCYCSNCIERGFANTSPESLPACLEPAPSSTPSESSFESLKDSGSPSIASRCARYCCASALFFINPFILVYNSPKTVQFLRYLYLPGLLFMPLYYSSQASAVLDAAEKCKDEYDEWIAVLETRVVNLDMATTSSSATLTNPEDIELQVLPSVARATFLERDRGRATPDSIRVPPPYSSAPAPSSPLARPLPPPAVVKLKDDWRRYIDSRSVEWKIAATTACVFVAASPTIFQIPDASSDPITRSIAFLALCRALSGIIYGPIFPIYFRGSRTRTAHFAMLWAQEAKKSTQSVFPGSWIMLSLPAVATCWATIFFLLAIFAFIWRTGSTADPSDWPTASKGRPPMSIDLALALRIVITSITVFDLGCMILIWRTLRSYSKKVWRDQDGGDAFPPTPGSDGRYTTRFGNITP